MMTNNATPLDDVLYALALAMPEPDPKTLEEFVRRYPQHADALTEFAVELALEPDADESDADGGEADDAVSPAVSRAISVFQNASYEFEKGSAQSAAAGAVANPFIALDQKAFRKFSNALGVTSVFTIKLRDRPIEPETILARPGFCQTAAEELDVPVEVMLAHFQGQATAMPAGMHFKADEKPAVVQRETFEEAVRNSGLSEEQQRRILSL